MIVFNAWRSRHGVPVLARLGHEFTLLVVEIVQNVTIYRFYVSIVSVGDSHAVIVRSQCCIVSLVEMELRRLLLLMLLLLEYLVVFGLDSRLVTRWASRASCAIIV